MPTEGKAKTILNDKNFRPYFIGRTISSFGDGLGVLGITFAVRYVTGSFRDLGIVLACATVPRLLFLLIGGSLGDRIGPKRLLVMCEVAMGLLQFVTGVVVILSVASLKLLIVSQVLYGSFSAVFAPVVGAAVVSVVESKDVQKANSVLGISTSVAQVVGPSAGGVLLVATSSPGWTLVLDGASFLISALLMLSTHFGSTTDGQNSTSLLRDLSEGRREFFARRWMVAMVTGFSVYQATILPVILLVGPAIALARYNDSAWGLVLGARAFGATCGGLLTLKIEPQHMLRVSTVLLLADIPFLVVLGWASPFYLALVAAAGSGLGLAMADTFWISSMQLHVPRALLSRMSSYDWLGSLTFAPVGLVFVGWLAVELSYRWIAIGAMSTLVVSRVLLLTVREVRNQKRPPALRMQTGKAEGGSQI